VSFSVVIGLVIGVVSAVCRDRAIDHGLRLFALFGLSIPNFWVAMILILLPALWWHYLPPMGYVSPFRDLTANLRQFLAPAAALGWALSASVMRITRSEMLEVLSQDYVRTAWAKGLQQRSVLLGHCLRNALIPIVTIIGIQLGFLLGGTVAVETVYGLPGVGTLLLNGINQRDYPIVQAGVMVLALWFIIINLTVDLTYAVIDPRIRFS
jgi:peptide/nickel transport system permease protein